MKIAVIGANGQVGREVSLFLHVMGVEVIPISRTEIGGVFLERCGLTCRYGSVSNESDVKRLLNGCDLVADFAHPRDLPAKIRESVKSNIDNVVRHAPQGAPYVYISTISAYGMGRDDSKMKNYFFARTTYAADKRCLERFALSQQSEREIYVLRLGQVHGFLQKVSHEFMKETASGEVRLPFSADTNSYTVFCYSIAEALINIMKGRERPGKYTFVSTPEWSWGDIYNYWASQRGVELNLVASKNLELQTIGSTFLRNLKRFLLAPIMRVGVKHKQLILNIILVGFPSFQEKMQAEYLRRNAIRELSYANNVATSRKFQIGKIPGNRLVSLSDSRLTMSEATLAVKVIVDAAAPKFDTVAATTTK